MAVTNIKNLMLYGKLTEYLYISGNFENVLAADRKGIQEFSKEQQGDIPAFYGYVIDNIFYEINVVDNIIVGISTKLENNFRIKFPIEGKFEESNFVLRVKSSLLDFTKFLNSNEINWEIDKVNSREKSLGIIINSLTTIMY
jgi:hypothetical protein